MRFRWMSNDLSNSLFRFARSNWKPSQNFLLNNFFPFSRSLRWNGKRPENKKKKKRLQRHCTIDSNTCGNAVFIMRPENEHLHADRMQSPNDSLTTSDWNANRSAKFEENHTTTNGTNGGGGGVGVGGGHTNGDAILKQRNGGHVDSQTWLPLLSHHVNQIDHNNMPTTNNNKWPALNSPAANLSNSKYTWKELPQDENSIALFKSPANGANALNGLRNVHSDKSEHESLTGIVRSPLNGNHYTNNNENDDHHRLHRYNDNNNDHDDDDVDGNGDDRSNCGIGLCKPKWARMFASTHVFMVIFLLAWILQVNT